jgi:hypothetical protein
MSRELMESRTPRAAERRQVTAHGVRRCEKIGL